MTTTIKSGEALSHGHIFDKAQKEKESQEIAKQTKEFYKSQEKKK